MSKKIIVPRDKNIVKVSIEEAMPDNYLPYAVEVAKDRALPDVRDGLKPVHRRIIYGSYMLKAFPDKPYYKSARIVGDILGKYHPHGDTSVYDAMVILAQDFTTRKPLIDGQGNWGSMDGDSAAAMRYTEARLTPIAMEMIRDIDKGVVNMVDNYSNSEKEPEVLPARYPNLLVNGAFGIAVGLATNIPPHNLGEVIDASIACMDNPEINTKELMHYIKGPDLPTGGIIIGKNSMLSAYETGEGRVTLRAKTFIERLESGRLGIVITEFPYRRSKAKLLQIISEMTADKKHSKALEAISDIRDESDRTGVRAVIEFRKSADEDVVDKVLKYLFKRTDLQCNISYNMVAIAEGKPQTLGLKPILHHYINHQKEVVTKRTERELEIAEKRFHVVEGFIKAIGIMDQIIETIRASKSKKDAGKNLMDKFGFTEIQAEAILELMLYRLTGLEIVAFEKEHKELERQIKKLKKILGSEKELLSVIKKELLEIKERFADNRKTVIVENDEEAKIDIEELIVEEDIVITMSNEGFIKRIPVKTYNRLNTGVEDIEYREGDFNKFLINSNTKNSLMFFTDKGNMYQSKGINIPEFKWKEKGERLDSLIRGLDLSQEKIIAFYSIDNLAAQKDFIFFTSSGCMKKTGIDKFNTNYTKIMALKLKGEENLLEVKLVDRDREEKFINIVTEKGLNFTIEEPKIEAADRGIINTQLFNLSLSDRVTEVDFTEEFSYKAFSVTIDKQGIIKISDKQVSRGRSTFTNSSSRILVFSSDGNVFSVPAVMLQNLGQKSININEIWDNIDQNKILSIISVSNFEEAGCIYFFTKKGMVKKTALSEFKGEYLKTVGYKFKSDTDSLISVKYIKGNDEEILLITKKAMAIRFSGESVSFMGKIAAGVTGISLKDDDEVIYADILNNVGNLEKNVLIKSKYNEQKTNVEDIKLQNRAGRGKNLMLLVMDDNIMEVK
ncbi:DNA topoisomerase IV subunit A [Clostridium magnum]|uniref:DNA topoisomerase (ATP-hydrolyzing) n=1 Tax=Clostridium magnum DSM 2767 TaxID=1121326 RepID=A0A161YSJ2_9CLOT|nr:DNA topoisomerase IV subunit A [Clostridium magnum]KZL94022.1 DNA gyrase subunit A [Clostridium magnum DSM 2767]SHI00550.1 DNA topoisomerase IV subunit A [Clostridium magnum DSM 2767]